jgi:tetratricopeptide (TPR) repeat protein
MSESITSSNPSVEESISLYEHLLESSPNDSAALEALATAYEKAGNTLRARATLIRLSRVLINKRDTIAAARVIEMLRPHAEADFDALEALTSLDIFVKENPDAADGGAGAAPAPATEPPPSGVILDKIILNREMALAWDLCSAGRLKQEEYSQIIEDLTVQIAESRGTAISVLHSVVDRQIPGFDGLMQHLSEKSRRPFIDLSAFEPQPQDLHGVPKSYLMRQGAIAFAEVGGELLIGLLNPVDETLRKDLRHYLGVPCHFYLVAPEAFDKAWEKLGD